MCYYKEKNSRYSNNSHSNIDLAWIFHILLIAIQSLHGWFRTKMNTRRPYHSKQTAYKTTLLYRHDFIVHGTGVANYIIYCFVLWPTNAQLFHKLSHCYMFRHYRVILRQPVISTLPSYTSILCCDQQMHNYFTNYDTATCFDTIVSSSDSL